MVDLLNSDDDDDDDDDVYNGSTICVIANGHEITVGIDTANKIIDKKYHLQPHEVDIVAHFIILFTKSNVKLNVIPFVLLEQIMNRKEGLLEVTQKRKQDAFHQMKQYLKSFTWYEQDGF